MLTERQAQQIFIDLPVDIRVIVENEMTKASKRNHANMMKDVFEDIESSARFMLCHPVLNVISALDIRYTTVFEMDVLKKAINNLTYNQLRHYAKHGIGVCENVKWYTQGFYE